MRAKIESIFEHCAVQLNVINEMENYCVLWQCSWKQFSQFILVQSENEMTRNYLRNIFREAVSGRSCTSSSIANTTLTNVSENRGKRVKYGQSVKLSISESPAYARHRQVSCVKIPLICGGQTVYVNNGLVPKNYS